MTRVIRYFKRYPYALVIIAVALVWMIVNVIQGAQAIEDLKRNGKYTLATIRQIKGGKGGRWVTVEFQYNGKNYTAQAKNISIPQSWIGQKVFIKFLPARPYDFDFYDTVKVSDSISNLSFPVWDTLPVFK